MKLIDTNILIDYFEGKLPLKYLDIISFASICTITLAEIADKFETKNIDFKDAKNFILNNFEIIPIDIEIAILAAKLKKEIRTKQSKFGLADALILATAKSNNLILYTKDNDFKDYATILKYK